MINLNTIATFFWAYNHRFFLETPYGNFIWSDPDYPGGNNTIIEFDGSYREWLDCEHLENARWKGQHRIVDYCGPGVIFNSGRLS